MQTDIAFYGSAQMLKFKNDFTKNLSLQMNPKNNYSLHCFIFQKIYLFIYLFVSFIQKKLCVSHGSEKQTRFY